MDGRSVFKAGAAFICVFMCLFSSSSADDSSQLRFLIVVFNTGLRSPLRTFPKDPNQESAWPQGFGQLTQKGMQNQYELGQFLRSKYSGYLNETYVAHEVYVQSLDVDRCLMSASAMLAGLYPPNNWQIWNEKIPWQPIPVHTRPANQDPFMAKCPMLDVLWSETLHSEEVQEFLEKQSVYRVAMEQLIGANLTNVFDLDYVFDALTCARENDLDVPDWPPNLVDIFTDVIYPFYQMAYHNGSETKRLISGLFVNEIVKFFNLRYEEILDPDLKAYFLSADERVIRSLLGGFDLYDFEVVPFSTAVVFELRHSDVSGHFVNVRLRNSTGSELSLLTIPGCDDDCPFDLFLNLTREVIPENWNLECYKIGNLAFTKLVRFILLLTIGIVAGLLVFVCSVALCCRKKLRRRVTKKYTTVRTERNNAFPEEMPMMNASVASDLED